MKALFVFAYMAFCCVSLANSKLLLESVSGQKNDNGHIVELKFNQDVKPDQFSLDFINETVQINLPSVQLPKGTQKSKLESDLIKSLYTYKVGNNLARTRVILNSDAMKYQSTTKLEAVGNTLKLVISNPVVPLTDEELKQAQEWVESAAIAEEAVTIQKSIEDKKKQESLKESEIPVLSTTQKVTTDKKTNTAARVITSLAIVLGLFGAFFLYARRNFVKAPKNKNTQVKVLTQHYLGPKKSLAIIRVAGESMLIGVTDNNINLIKTLALMDEEVPQETPKDFSSTLTKIFKKESKEIQDQDEFAISKIKDFVSGKLKDMKEL